MAQPQTRRIHYWRDKRGHEADFVLKGRGESPVAIECKWPPPGFDPSGMQAFRRQYEKGDNYVVGSDARWPVRRTFGNVDVTLTNISDLIKAIRAGNYSIL